MSSIRPLNERILVKRLAGEEVSSGGIVLPDSAVEQPDEGEIIAVGSGRRTDSGEIVPLEVSVGDKVLFGKYCGNDVAVEGEDFLIMREDDILAIVG
jgi:chaperonin GroES